MNATLDERVKTTVSMLSKDLSTLVNVLFESNPQGTRDAFATHTGEAELYGIDGQIEMLNKLLQQNEIDVCQKIVSNIPLIPENLPDPELWYQVAAEVACCVKATPVLGR